MRVSREQAVAFRLRAQGLNRRAAAKRLVEVAGRIGPQNTPPGSAGQALAARVGGITSADVDEALDEDKSLLQAFGARAAPHVLGTAEAAIHLRGLLPDDEAGLRAFMRGAQQALDQLGITATKVVDLAAAEVTEMLDGAGLVKDDLGRQVGERLAMRVPRSARTAWKGPSPYASDQFLGESVVRFALPVLSLRGILCHGGRAGRSPLFRRTDQWLAGGAVQALDVTTARAALVEWYLHHYGPSTPADFAAWGGIAERQAAISWAAAGNALEEIELGTSTAWVHRDDVKAIGSPSQPRAVRLLPPHDPYLQARDRTTLLPDRTPHQRIWRLNGNPGTVLASGSLVATWRPRAKGRTLDLAFEPFGFLSRRVIGEIEEEAERLAHHRDRQLGSLHGL